MILTYIVVNCVAWCIVQLSIAAVVTRMEPPHFATDGLLPSIGKWEIVFYRRWLGIRRWKRELPDGALSAGGRFSKRSLATRNPVDLRQLAVETRRGETAHWLMLACFPVFFFWNPPWARIVIALYAVAANLPCIMVQRYNRETLRRVLGRWIQ